MFLHCKHDKILTYDCNQSFGSIKWKQRFRAPLACNADGCEKLPQVVIGCLTGCNVSET